ncbi:ankyrin repeat domain-containing protein [Candidatus Dependentiae bacterium]|nr:ankyrin repeat domain-containing protein [Candidatus Dependentiae bacterium]
MQKNKYDISPLSVASELSSFEMVQYLLNHEANVNTIIYPIMSAIKSNIDAYKKVKILIDHGANLHINVLGETPLQYAIRKNKRDIVQLIYEEKLKEQQK